MSKHPVASHRAPLNNLKSKNLASVWDTDSTFSFQTKLAFFKVEAKPNKTSRLLSNYQNVVFEPRVTHNAPSVELGKNCLFNCFEKSAVHRLTTVLRTHSCTFVHFPHSFRKARGGQLLRVEDELQQKSEMKNATKVQPTPGRHL